MIYSFHKLSQFCTYDLGKIPFFTTYYPTLFNFRFAKKIWLLSRVRLGKVKKYPAGPNLP